MAEETEIQEKAAAPAKRKKKPKETESAGVSTAARRRAKLQRARHSRRFLALEKSLTGNAPLDPTLALTRVKEMATARFDETVETAINLGVDPKHGDQVVRGSTSLPHGTGKAQIVWVFARGQSADQATAAGADRVGAEDLVERIQKEGGASCDILVATPDMMPLVGKLGQILKQKMPNPKAGTVSPNAGQIVRDIKSATRAEYRVDKEGIIHAPIGKASYPVEHLEANLVSLVSALLKSRPSAAKGKYLKKITVTSTMGAGVPVDTAAAQKLAERV